MTLLMVQILSYQGHREEGSLVTKASFVSLLVVSRRRQRAASLYDTRQHPRSLRLEASLRYRRLETRRNLVIYLYCFNLVCA